MTKLLAAWLTLVLLLGLTTAPAQARDSAPLRNSMPLPIRVNYIDCGMANGFYHRGLGEVFLCNENAVELSLAEQEFILYHELAHATIHKLDIPVTGLNEVAADEYAAYVLIEGGHGDVIRKVGMEMMERGGEDNPGDPHTSNVRRGMNLLCLGMQADYNLSHPSCTGDYDQVKKTWKRLTNGI